MVNDLSPENNDALTLWDMLELVKSGWHWLIGGAGFGILVAVAFIWFVPAQYEAIAIIQPATVGITTTTTTTTTTKGVEVESTAQTLERLKTPTFYTDLQLQACDVQSRINARRVLATAIKPTLVKGNSLIQISYRADSPALAEACVADVVAQLAKVQAALSEPIIKTLDEQRLLTKQQLDESERFQNQIEKRAISMDPSDAKFSQAMLMLNAALSKREEISKLRKLYTEQSMLLSAPLTQPTQLFEPIDASDKAVFPKKGLTVAVGLMVGLMVGGLMLFVRRSWLGRQR
jgi:LPS O-antigen subunit length determinant protein (WzzB/FepE family)